jgi:hypothetical protein
MGAAQSGTDPLRHLADDRAVGVVHTDQFLHLGRHARDGTRGPRDLGKLSDRFRAHSLPRTLVRGLFVGR